MAPGCHQRVTFAVFWTRLSAGERLLGALPRLRARQERVPVAAGRDARCADLGQRVEPAVRGRRTATAGRLLAAARLSARWCVMGPQDDGELPAGCIQRG
jgi:hypothetical protein